MNLGLGNRFLRVMMAFVTTASITIVSCTSPTPPPPSGGEGPRFLINNPTDGGLAAGTFFFSVQPLDPAGVARVEFEVDGANVATDTTAADGFRVAISARNHAAGPLELTAIVTGTNGRSRSASVTVENVPNPPSTTVVGPDGAVLATDRGSTLGIRPGDAAGATVSFAERSQNEVRNATGVDYGELGVTFLGAQEVTSDRAITEPLMVSSAEFASFVQAGQAVVNYAIAPDADGDGVGELVVVNSASVAGDDVISDPIPGIQLGTAEIRSQRGTVVVRTLQDGITGAPGTMLSLELEGLNPLSLWGNNAVFEAQGETWTLLGLAMPRDGESVLDFGVMIPPLPAGPATLTIISTSTGAQAGPIDLVIESLPVTAIETAAAGEVAERFLSESISFLGTLPTDEADSARHLDEAVEQLERALPSLQALRALLAEEPNAELEDLLHSLDSVLSNSGLLDRLAFADIIVQELTPEQDELIGDISIGIAFVAAVFAFGALVAFGTAAAPFVAAVAAGVGLAIASMHLYRMIERRFRPGCSPAINAIRPLVELTPGGLLLLGMGSAPPAGGSGCGSAGSGTPAASTDRAMQTQQSNNGVILIRFFVGGTPLAFTSVTDAAGYFFVPMIPAGQPFTAVATDLASNEVRIFEGIGPAVGDSIYMIFDFSSDDDALPGIPLDSNTASVLEPDEAELFTFVGTAGQLITLASQGAPDFVGGYDWDVTSLSGSFTFAQLGGGRFYSESAVHELPESGVYTLSVSSRVTTTSSGEGEYHVGLSEIAPPTPVDITISPATVDGEQAVFGDRHFYSFSAEAGDIHKFSLSLPDGSQFNALMSLRGPDPAPFYQGTNLIGSNAFVLDSKRIAVTHPFVVPANGEYVLEIERGGSSGPLEESLGAWSFSVLTPDPATTVAVGDTVLGEIDLPGEIDLYTFVGAAGQMVDFQTQDLAAEVDQVNWRVSAPDGTVLFDAPLFSDPGTLALPQTGTYAVMVGSDNDTGTGTYTLVLQEVP